MTTRTEIEEVAALVAEHRRFLERVRDNVETVILGQSRVIDRLLIALLCDGHALLEGVPGVGKSLLVSTLANSLSLSFRRIQFTPDLLPADLTGTLFFRPERGEFVTRKGPVFAQIVLADEINRAPPKVQSALLEAMQERQVTIGEQSHPLPVPFFVLATQNPIEQEGTYRLPEAELDRFLLKVRVDYPGRNDELRVLQLHGRTERPRPVEPVGGAQDVARARHTVDRIHVDDRIHDYILRIVEATRGQAGSNFDEIAREIQYGVSPRAALGLLVAAKGHALLNGRAFVTPHDVKTIAGDVLSHRLVLTLPAEARGTRAEHVIAAVLERVAVP